MSVTLLNSATNVTRKFQSLPALKASLRQRATIATGDEKQEIRDLLNYKDEFIERVQHIEGHTFEIWCE